MKTRQRFNHEIREPRESKWGCRWWVIFAFFCMASGIRAQQPPLGHATDFTSDTYFEPPNQQQVKMRLSGAEASPLPGGLLDVSRLKVEMFDTNGVTQAVVRAPQCFYAPLDGQANSAGRLEIRSGDGKFFLEGEGFLLRQTNWSLTISNRVRTVIEMPAVKKIAS